MNNQQPKTIAETKFLKLVERGTWSFVQRQSNVRIVAIVAVTDEKLILVEQYRPPTNSRVIELPAGLAGDIAGQESETLQTAAQRELEEEAGYTAAQWQHLANVTSSAGLTDERVDIFLARQLQKTGTGGGDDSEDITVHEVPLVELENWLADRAKNGFDIDSRVFAALHWASRDKGLQ